MKGWMGTAPPLEVRREDGGGILRRVRTGLGRMGLAALLSLSLTAPGWGQSDEAYQAYKRGDYAEAHRVWKMRADRDDASAQYNLGLLYEHGLGVERQLGEAVKWYGRAAENGDAQAQKTIGDFYVKGFWGKKDHAKAALWYERAAKQGHAEARRALAAAQRRLSSVVVLGGTISRSGLGYWGKYAKAIHKGQKLCVEQINARGGLLGHKIELRIYDDKKDAATAVRLYKKLITEDKIDLVLGPSDRHDVLDAVVELMERYKRPFIEHSTTEFIHPPDKKWKYVFTLRIPDPVRGFRDRTPFRNLPRVKALRKKHKIGEKYTYFWDQPRIKAFYKKYKKRYGEETDRNNLVGCAAIMTLESAVKRAGSFDPEKVREAFASQRTMGMDMPWSLTPWKGPLKLRHRKHLQPKRR